MAKKPLPMPFPEVGAPPAYPGPIANAGNTKPQVGVLPAAGIVDPVGSFTHQPAIFPSPAPSDYTKPGSPFGPPMPFLGPGETSPYQNPNFAQNQQSQKALGALMPVQAGLNAGAAVTATPRASDAILQTAGAAAAGAAQGAAVGSVVPGIGTGVGAAVGGFVGLVSGGIQAFTGLRAARDQARKEERMQRDILARQAARDAQARADAQENMRYNRRVAALQSNWAAQQEAGRRINEMMDQDQELRQLFIANGR